MLSVYKSFSTGTTHKRIFVDIHAQQYDMKRSYMTHLDNLVHGFDLSAYLI